MSTQSLAHSDVEAAAIARRPLLDILRCPKCAGELRESGLQLVCAGCGQTYPVTNGIPQLFVPNEWGAGQLDVTDIVKEFYETTPFPNYDDLDSRESLRRKATAGVFAKLLDEQIEPGALVLEAGCGTGQLSNFLGMDWRRRVVGADLCMNSLGLAKGFRDGNAIVNADFAQMNLFRPPFADGTFDVVICNGVLHHTADPAGGFRSLAAKVKPGGMIAIGLYNWLGRLPTLWRRRAIEIFGERMAALDPRLRGGGLNRGRWAAWYRDQYRHPHESKHSYDEVLRWFDAARFDYRFSVPPIGDMDLMDGDRLFEPHSPRTKLQRWATELELLMSGGVDGGLYITIGQKRPA